MKSDRELLELAAKAAGFEPYGYNGAQMHIYHQTEPLTIFKWKPAENDGDALRLSAKLSINIDFADQCAWKRLDDGTLIQEFWGGDYPPCYRHAILRAAAEIGSAAGIAALGDGGKAVSTLPQTKGSEK